MFFCPRKLQLKIAIGLSFVFLFSVSVLAQKNKTPVKTAPLVKKTAAKKNTRAEAERLAAAKRVEDERRRNALETQRRRDQAAREARARRVSFERGLRNTTVDNISADLTDGEDLEVRRAAVEALGDRAGTVVVLEPQTGRVLTIVNQEWAIRQSFKPCSVIKLVTSVAGLNEDLINSNGAFTGGNLGIALDDALAYSNNAYFQRVGVNLGSGKMIDYARILGLGAPTGLNAAGESAGRLPFGNNNARIYSHGDDFAVTPLQLAVLVSALSNGGRVVIPQIPRPGYQRTAFRGLYRRQIDLPKSTLEHVLPGMIGAATYGTARNGVDAALGIAGKTGSCIGQGSWLGLFASVAPVRDPKFAVVVITRGQSERGKYAAAVAGRIYESLRGRLFRKGSKTPMARVPVELRPQPRIDAKTSIKLDDARTEDSDDDTGTVRVGKKGAQDQIETPKQNPKKQEPLFPTIVITPKSDEITRPRVVKPR
jgi:membrane peptidoglycan carboxypeptidase